MNVLVIHNGTGSRHYRWVPLFRHIQEKTPHTIMIAAHDDAHLAQRVMWADTVLFQMVFSSELIAEAKRLGKRCVFEADDLLHSVPKEHYSHAELKGLGGLKWWWRAIDCIRRCDAFVCTTEPIMRAYGWAAKEKMVFPNYMDGIHWLKPVRRNMGDEVRILWAGSTSHTADLNFVKPIMKRVLERCPEAKFIYIGTGGVPTDDLYSRFVYGEDIFEGLPKGRYEPLLPVPSVVWPYILNGALADVAIAPLVPSKFAKCKSQCKFIEYGINALPGVYSRWHYTDVRDGLDGILADTPQEWEEAIVGLIKDREWRLKMGEAARERMMSEFDVRPHLDRWCNFVLGGKGV